MPPSPLAPPADLNLQDIALFFDVDGTLIELEKEPDAVIASASLIDIMGRLHEATSGALALVSGRSIQQLDAIFGQAHFSASGLHGLERRCLPGGVARAVEDKAVLQKARTQLADFAADRKGILVEDKGLTLALHYRNAPEHYDVAMETVRALIDGSDGALTLIEGKMVLELKPPGTDKGRAIAAFMNEPSFRGRRPVFTGDDVTDEYGFEAINNMNGISIRVGKDGRPTAAAYAHANVDAVYAWLEDLLERDRRPLAAERGDRR